MSVKVNPALQVIKPRQPDDDPLVQHPVFVILRQFGNPLPFVLATRASIPVTHRNMILIRKVKSIVSRFERFNADS